MFRISVFWSVVNCLNFRFKVSDLFLTWRELSMVFRNAIKKWSNLQWNRLVVGLSLFFFFDCQFKFFEPFLQFLRLILRVSNSIYSKGLFYVLFTGGTNRVLCEELMFLNDCRNLLGEFTFDCAKLPQCITCTLILCHLITNAVSLTTQFIILLKNSPLTAKVFL